MGNYICLKPVKLSGIDYFPGGTIPEGAVVPGRDRALKKNGLIADMPAASEDNASVIGANLPQEGVRPAEGILLPIGTGEDAKEENFAAESVRGAVAIVQLSEKDAKNAIAGTEDMGALRLIAALDRRKNVDQAVTSRLEELAAAAPEGGGEEDGPDV